MFDFIIELYKFFTEKKFELENLGDLSSYSYDDMCVELSNFNKKVKFKGNRMLVTWESAKTILVIKYDLDGRFIEKIEECWK
jgi:hypothetical protein